jgi:hypothetical protein
MGGTYGLVPIAPSVRDAGRGLRLVAALLMSAAPALGAQTVIRDSTPSPRDTSRPRSDTAARPSKSDSAAKPAAAAASPPTNTLPKGVCSQGEEAGSDASDVLLVSFRRRSGPADRQAALKAVNGKLIAPDPSDDALWYVKVPSGGNEFVLRSIADRLIRAPVVTEVGPVQCPARP